MAWLISFSFVLGKYPYTELKLIDEVYLGSSIGTPEIADSIKTFSAKLIISHVLPMCVRAQSYV